MSYKREYYPSDTLKLINQSEGLMVRNRTRMTPLVANEPAKRSAHAIGRHLLKNSPGALGLGVEGDDFKDRFKNSPTYDDGASRFSSVWLGKGDMAVLLCETLNSQIGQAALGALDRGVKRVAIHYLNEGKLASLFDGLVGSTRMSMSEILITPEQTVMEWREFHNHKKGTTIRKQLPKKIPESRDAQVSAEKIASIHLVLDAFSDGIHVQTLYPSHEASPSTAEWQIGNIKVLALIGSGGKIEEHISPGN